MIKIFYKNIVVFLIFLLILGACTTKSDTYYNRQFKMIPTMYNVLYNGNEALLAGQKQINEQYKDNFFDILPVEPISLNQENAIKEDENFNRAEEKAIKAIQKHSMVFNGIQKNRKMDDAYMLLGKARFYNQRFIPALEAFNHLLTNYGETNQRIQALIWREKTHLQLGRDQMVINHLNHFSAENKTSRQERADIQATLSQAFINLKDYQNAIKALKIAARETKIKQQRGRYYFIIGQLFENLQQRDSSVVYFEKVTQLNRKISRKLWIEAQVKRIENQDFNTENLAFIEKQEKKYEHKDFLDILYFSHAKLHQKNKNEKQAIKFLKKSLKENKSNDKLKQKSYNDLAEIYFNEKQYAKAHSHYDSTLVFVDKNTLEHLYLRRKRDNLTEISQQEKIVFTADSILKIINLSKEEKNAYFQKHIDSINQAQEKLNIQNAFSTGNNNLKPEKQKEFKGFYFYNQEAVLYGKQNFEKLFGTRPLVDNWRFSSLIRNSQNAQIKQDSLQNTSKEISLLSVEDFIAKLPSSEKISKIKQDQNDALFRLGIIYNEKFSDKNLATNRLERILKNQASEELTQKTLYELYRIWVDENPNKALIYKENLLKNHSNSAYSLILKNTQKVDESTLWENLKELYKSFDNQEFTKVLQEINHQQNHYKTSPQAPEWELLKAKVLGRLKGVETYRQELEKIVKNYPNSKISAETKNILNQLTRSPKTDFEKDHQASSWKIIFEDISEEIKKKIEQNLDEKGMAYIKITEDIYTENQKFIVLHGFFTKDQAQGILKDISEKISNLKSFTISAENYSILQIYKNKEEYLNL